MEGWQCEYWCWQMCYIIQPTYVQLAVRVAMIHVILKGKSIEADMRGGAYAEE